VLVNSSLSVPPAQIQDRIVSGSVTPAAFFGQFNIGSLDPSRAVPSNPSFVTFPFGIRGNPYIQQWNAGIEFEVLPATALSVSYVGSKGANLMSNYQGNPALPPAAGALQARRRWPLFGALQFVDSDMFSSYNALQAKAERRFRNGLSFLSSYTWAKAIDNDGPHQSSANRIASKANSDNDLRHRFTLAAVYQLPFGKGQALLSDAHPAIRALVGGWQTNAIVTLRTGLTYTATVPGDTANAGAGTMLPNVTGTSNGNLSSGQRNIDRWFDVDAFTRPAALAFGSAGRNILYGPESQTIDFGLMRWFTIREAHKIQFRAEFFNLANRANFGLPAAAIGNVGVGTIRSTGQAREVQLALKYQF
jgi:hypothetical protein